MVEKKKENQIAFSKSKPKLSVSIYKSCTSAEESTILTLEYFTFIKKFCEPMCESVSINVDFNWRTVRFGNL